MDPVLFVAWYVTLLVSLVVHEAAHALFALLGGDRTAYITGQVSLNPIPHIRREPFGTVILPLAVLFFSSGQMCMGYASTPIDPEWAYRNPKKAALMSAAGPLSNILLAAIAFGVLKTLVVADLADGLHRWPLLVTPHEMEGPVYAVALLGSLFLLRNIVLAILNLIPFPPLDGAGILEGLFPKQVGPMLAFIRTQPIFTIILFVLIFNFLQYLWVPVLNFVFHLL
ncbi:MAG: site-2 protease family protein [Planctomycetota bacterium]